MAWREDSPGKRDRWRKKNRKIRPVSGFLMEIRKFVVRKSDGDATYSVPARDASYDCRHCFQLGNGRTMPPPPPINTHIYLFERYSVTTSTRDDDRTAPRRYRSDRRVRAHTATVIIIIRRRLLFTFYYYCCCCTTTRHRTRTFTVRCVRTVGYIETDSDPTNCRVEKQTNHSLSHRNG